MTQVLAKNSTKNYSQYRLSKAVERVAQANRVPVGDAQNLAQNVIRRVKNWLDDKSEVTAKELRLATVNALANYDEGTAYFYENENKLF